MKKLFVWFTIMGFFALSFNVFAQTNVASIQSCKITKTGKIMIQERPVFDDPLDDLCYALGLPTKSRITKKIRTQVRPIMVIIKTKCSNLPGNKIYTFEDELTQTNDKWGKWTPTCGDSGMIDVANTLCVNKFAEIQSSAYDEASKWYNNANIYREKGNNKQAIHDYTKAIELYPKYAKAYIFRGYVYNILGKYNEAIADSNKAIELDPKLVDSYIISGSAHISLNKYNEAIADANKAIKLEPNFARGYMTRASGYIGLGKYDEAVADSSKAIDLNPKSMIAHNNRGYAYIKLGKYDEAIIDLNKAIELDPMYPNSHYHRARAYSLIGHNEQSLQDLTKAIQLNPNYRNQAKTNTDFDNIRNTPEFIRLMGE